MEKYSYLVINRVSQRRKESWLLVSWPFKWITEGNKIGVLVFGVSGGVVNHS